MSDAVVEITSLGRPTTMNRVIRDVATRYGERTAWRNAAHAEALLAGAVELPDSPCAVEVTVLYAGGPKQDVGACAPAAKAAIDGLVLAGWLDDDSPAHIARITYLPHQPSDEHGLRIALVN